MNTPIYDFINKYSSSNPVRLHMPGHKGVNSMLGIEQFDITEIEGADELFAADGIIAQSEANASKLFGCPTFYSTEGSSLAIRAMLFLLVKYCKRKNIEPAILAARNVHKTFINTVALLDIKTEWINREPGDSLEECHVNPQALEEQILSMSQSAQALDSQLSIMTAKPAAVYITSPDYLGNVSDIKAIADICHKHGILLLVDNAHGAYLKFVKADMAEVRSSRATSLHPIDLGADICADSAHKTLPVLTGGAYLHISDNADLFFRENAKQALEMFGSTSPSYLIMASLDLANDYLETLPQKLREFAPAIEKVKSQLTSFGYILKGDEPLKITVDMSHNGNGHKLAERLMAENVYPEYVDDNHVVFMLTPENSQADLNKFVEAMGRVPEAILQEPEQKEETPKSTQSLATNNATNYNLAISNHDEFVAHFEPALSAHDAVFADYEELPAKQCAGRILAAATVSCPPAVPVFMMGERIGTDEYTRNEILGKILAGKTLRVVKEDE